MLMPDLLTRLTRSSLGYFSDADVESYLQLKRAVTSACTHDPILPSSSAAATDRIPFPNDIASNTNTETTEHSSGDVANAVNSHINPRKWLSKEDNPLKAVKSADFRGERRPDGGRSDGGTLRRFGSAVKDSTIASRSKIRPEPKFQRVITSQVLSQMRKDSHLIAKNPCRFLQAMVDGPQKPPKGAPSPSGVTQEFSSYLTNLTTQGASEGYRQTIQNLQEKCRQAKNRTLLLNLGGGDLGGDGGRLRSRSQSSRASSANSDAFITRGEPKLTNQQSPNVDDILQSYLDDIRNANVNNIKAWLETPSTLHEMDFPIGFPSSDKLRIPLKNLENLQSESPAKIEFVKSAFEEFFLLDAEYHAKLEELVVRVHDNRRELEVTSWTIDESALLLHLMNITTQRKSQHFSGEKLCTEVATRLFHGLHSKDSIVEQKYRLKVRKALEEQRDSAIKQWVRDKDKLVKKLNMAWVDIERQEEKKWEWRKEKKAQQDRCKFWTDLLENMREDNRQKIRAISVLVEPLEEQIKRQQKVTAVHEQSRRIEEKEMLRNFQRIKLEHEEDQRRHREQIQEKLEKDRKLRRIQNRARVHLRRREWEEKKEQEKEVERRKEEDRRIREEMLEQTKEKVEITWGPWNVLNDTHASLVRSHEIQSLISLRDRKEEEVVQFFRERYSFSAETLWKDTRVRLEAKLREVGLMGNSYARQVLQAMQPKEKPHLQSQIKFDNNET